MIKLLHQKILRMVLLIALLLAANVTWGQYILNESFDASTTPPTDWTYVSIIHNTNNPRTGARSAVFNGNNDAIITPLLENPNLLSFYYKRSSSSPTTPAFAVYQSISPTGPWSQVGTSITSFSTTYQQFTANLSSYNNIYIRVLHTRAGGTNEIYLDDFTVTENTTVIGTITPTTLPDFSTVVGTPSSSQSFTVASGSNLTGNITALAGTSNFQVSLDDITFTNSVIFANPAVGQTRTVYVRFNTSTTGTKLGSVSLSSTGASSKIVSFRGLIGAIPAINSLLTDSTIYSTTDTYTITTSTGTAPITYNADLTGLPTGATFLGNTITFAENFPVGNYTIPITATNSFGNDTENLVYSRTAKALTLTGGIASNKIYDGLTDALLTTTPSLGNILTGDEVTLTGTPVTAFANSGVGNHQITVVSGYTLTGTAAGNYTLTLPQQPTGLTASITAEELTISGITISNKVYDGNVTATIIGTPALNGIINNEDVTLDTNSAAVFTTNQAGITIPVTVTGYTLSGDAVSNYTLQQPSALTADITAKELTITGISIQDKLEDGTTTATILGTPTLDGVINSDDVTLDSSSSTAAFATALVGAAIPVSITGYSINGTAIGNYTLQQPQGLVANITSASLQNQTITFDPLTAVTYGDSSFPLTATANPSGLTVTYTSSDENVATVTGNTITVVGIGTTIITANQTGNASFNPAPSVIQSLVVNKKTLTVAGAVVSDKTYNKTTDAIVTNGTLTGIVLSDVVVLDGSTGTFASDDVANGIAVTSQYSISGIDAGKYMLDQPVLTGNILPEVLTLTTPVANNKIYDGTVAAVITGTLSGILNGDIVTFNGAGTFASANAGTAINVSSTTTLSGLDAGNYILTQPTGLTADITKYGLTVNATTHDKEYDRTTNATITATLNGVIGIDDVIITGNGSFDNFNVDNNKTITSNLVLSGAEATNYTLIQPTGLTASITSKSITIDITNTVVTTKNYDGNTTASLTNTVLNGVVTGDEANVTALTGTFAQTTPGTGIAVNNIVLAGTAAGNYTLTQPGALTGTILPAVLTITNATAQNKIYDKTNSAVITGTLSGIRPTEIVTFNGTGTFATVTVANGITVIATASLNGANASNYILTQPTGLSANITPIALSITATAQDKQYNGNVDTTVNGAQISTVSILPGDDVSLVSASVAGTFNNANVGTGKPVSALFSLQGTDAINYSITAQTYPATITGLNLTVDASNASVTTKVYDNNTNAVITGLVLNGVLIGDTVNATNGNFASANAGANIPVTVILSGAQAGNYTLTQPTTVSTGTINKKALTATADNKTKNQGTVNPTLTISYTGFVSGQTAANATGFLAPTTTTTAVTSSPMGAYPITLSGGTADNYELSLTNNWLVVNPPTTVVSSGTIWSNNITDSAPNSYNPYTIGDNVPGDAYIDVSGIGRGNGITGNAASGRYNAKGWELTFDSNDYYSFTITPITGYKLNLTDFVYNGQASSSGPNAFAVKSSIDNYTATIPGGSTSGTINLSASTYQNLTQSITFRIYGWGGNSPTGTFSINDFSFNGSIVQAPTTAPPVITSPLASNSSIGDADTYQITVTGTPVITLTTTNLPIGATVNTSGLINFDGTTPAGVYSITLNATSFYGATSKTLVYTVNKINQVLTFDPDPIPTKYLGDPDFVLEASSSASLPITLWVSSNPAVATIAADGTVTILGVGTTTLTASNTGNGIYNPIAAGRLLTVLPTPTLLATPTPIALTAIQGQGASAPVQLTSITGSNLVPAAGTISLTVTTGFEIATGIGTYGSSDSFTYTGGTINQANPQIFIRLAAGHAVGTYTGTLTISGGNATLQIPLNATVDTAPAITTTAANFGPYCAGTTNTVSLSYTTQGTFSTASFYIQHSDALGVFPNDFSNIISAASSNTTITTTLPSTLTVGNYKLRIVNLSSGLVLTSSTNDNGSNVVINSLPTLSGVSTTCSESNAPILLTGLLANATFTINYTIDGGTGQQELNVQADALGNATFEIPVTAANNGQVVTITELIRTDTTPDCNKTFTTNNTVTINVTPAPIATPLAFCTAATVANLTATGTNLKWYAALNGGSVLTNTTALATGNYYVSQTLNGCESTRTEVAVTINVTPVPTATPLAFCTAATVANLTATGTNLKWYANLNGGLVLVNTTVLATGNYYVSQTLNGCESTRTQVAVTINVTPVPTATPLAFCTTATVANLTATGTNLKWYAALTGGSTLVNTTALATGNYYVSQTLNGCESTRTQVAVTINVTPVPTATPLAFCTTATVANLTATGTNLKWYAALTGGSTLVNTTALATGNYYVSQTLNGCESTRTQVAVTINVTPVPTATPLAFCSAATVANLTATGTNLKWYAALTGGSTLVNTTTLATGNYYVSQTINGCESTRTQVAVTINVTPAPTAAPLAFCTAATVANLTATGTNLKWYANLNGGSVLTNTTALATGNYYVSQTINGCESTRTEVAVTINVTPVPTAAPLTFCTTATVANLTATGTNLKWYANLNGGSVLVNTTALTTGNYYVSQTLNGCESTRTEVAITINVTPVPTAAPLAFCSAATVANLTATGTDLKWYAALTGGSTLVNTTALATGNYYVSQTINGCESTRTEVAVTINVTPVPTASPLAFCSAATVANLTATGTNLKWYANLNGGLVLVNTTVLATGNYYVSQTINGCESTRTQVAVTINVTPVPTAAPLAFCMAATVANLTATGTNLKWYAVLNGGSVLTNTTALATGNYYVSQTLNGCESTRTEVAVTINVTPVPTAAPLAFCTAATVANLTATGTNLKWYANLNGGSVLVNTTALATGNYYVSQTINGCESTRTEVAVTINVTPVPTAAPLAFCTAATVANLTATGTNLKWYAALTGGSVLTNTTALATGNYYVSQTLNGCESTRTQVVVTINVTPAPTATPLAFCTAATVANLTATGTSLKWYATLTGGSVLTNTTALATGNYYVSQTINGCESTRTQVAVTINVTPTPTAAPLAFCTSATVANLTATGTNLKWYAALTGGSVLTNTTALTTGNYYVSQTINGCESTRTEVVVTINVTPVPTAAPLAFCTAATVANLTATGTGLKWYATLTGGSVLTNTTVLATGNYYVSQTINGCESTRTEVAVTINVTPVPTAAPLAFCTAATVANLTATGTGLKWYATLTGGSVLTNTTALTTGNYFVSQTINGCESTRTEVAVTINITPVPTAAPLAFCSAATVANLTATGTNLKWYANLNGGSVLVNTTALATGNYYVSQTINGCESTRTQVAVTINVTPTPTAAPLAFCTTATVANLTATGTNLKWYAALTGGSVLTNTTALTTGNYYVSQTINGCESTRTEVVVTINVTPVPTAAPLAFCTAATVANLTATGTGLKWYATLTGGSVLTNTTALTTGNYYVSQTINGCESTRTEVVVTINVTPVPTAAPLAFCMAATVANLTATGTNLKWYAALNGGSVLTNTTALVTGNYYVSQTINGCESTRTQVAVTINVTPVPTAAPLAFCSAATVANLTATGTNLKWYANLNGGLVLVNTTVLATGNYYVSQTINGCESTRTEVAVTINVTPVPTAAPLTFCTTATVANLTATGTNLKWYANLNGGSVLVNTTALATGNYYVSQTLNGCESTRTEVAITINVTPVPTAAPLAFCSAATVANLTATGTDLKWYAALTGGSTLVNTTALATGNYYVSQTINGCESTRTEVAVTINVTPVPTASPLAFCSAATVANLTATGTNLKWYANLNGGLVLVNTTVLATGNYYVSQTINGCESTRTQVAVTINVTPVPTAAPLAFCMAATVANLTATGTNLKWYAVLNGGSVLTNTTALATGNYYVSQTLNGCESTRTEVAVTINVTPVPTAAPLAFCTAATVANLTATGTNLKWYANLNGGSVLVNTTALATGNYYVSQTINGCESTRTEVAVIMNPTPSPTATPMVFCQLAFGFNLTATGTNLKWYTALTGGTLVTETTPLVTGNYYVSQTIDGCESLRTLVSVTINITPMPTANPQVFCQAATVANLTATGTNLKWYGYPTSGLVLENTAPLTTGNYYVSQTINGCESKRTLVSVTISIISMPFASSQTFCENATIANLVATGNNLKWYTTSTGGTTLDATAALTTGNYYVSQTINGCESQRKMIQVTTNTTVAPLGETEQQFTEGATIADLEVQGENIKWYPTKADAIAGTNALSVSTTLINETTYYATQTIGCESNDVLAVTVTVTLGVHEVEKFTFTYYPNPVINELHISAVSTITNVTVYSLSGQEVINQKWNKEEGILDMSTLAAEMYLVKINFGSTEKIIKVVRSLK